MVQITEIDDSSPIGQSGDLSMTRPSSPVLGDCDSTNDDLNAQVLALQLSDAVRGGESVGKEWTDTSPMAFTDFVGSKLVASDGYVVPFLSNCFSWSLRTPWLMKFNPSLWLDRHRGLPSSETYITSVFSPANDYLVLVNKDLVEFTGEGSSVRVKQTVHSVTCGTLASLDNLTDAASMVCTSHLFSQLVDKLMWAHELKRNGAGLTVLCLDEADEKPTDIRLFDPANPDQTVKKKIKKAKKFHDKYESDWKRLVVDFIEKWNGSGAGLDVAQETSGPGEAEGLVVATQKPGPTKVFLQAVWDAGHQSHMDSKVSKVLTRIYDAILGLCSLRLLKFKEANAYPGNRKVNFFDILRYVIRCLIPLTCQLIFVPYAAKS